MASCYLLDLLRGKWEAPELNRQAKAFLDKHKEYTWHTKPIRYMKVEDKASGTQLIQTLGTYSGVAVIPVQRNTDKLSRFMDVQVHLEANYKDKPDDRFVIAYLKMHHGSVNSLKSVKHSMRHSPMIMMTK